MNEIKPLFKYIGGKTWMKNHLRQELEHLFSLTKSETYVEPFAGGLGAFFGVYDVLLRNGIKNIILNDINPVLIAFYKQVKTNPDFIIKHYVSLENSFNKLIPLNIKNNIKTLSKEDIKVALKDAENFYLEVRDSFNKEKDVEQKTYKLLFLQKHCFNGIYRENSKGEYNTPFNWGVNEFREEDIKEKIQEVQKVFNLFNIEFNNQSYIDISYNKSNIYYLDPPYINDDILENKYNKDVFTAKEQFDLIEKIKDVPFIYSNHKNQKLLDKFNESFDEIHIREIKRKNIISSSAKSRAEDKIEILITKG